MTFSPNSCFETAHREAKIEKTPNREYYDVGSNVNLSCEAQKDTNLFEIVWYKLDSPGKLIKLKSALNGPGILTIKLNSLSKENAGSYKCVISRPQVNYSIFQFVNINVKGRTKSESIFYEFLMTRFVLPFTPFPKISTVLKPLHLAQELRALQISSRKLDSYNKTHATQRAIIPNLLLKLKLIEMYSGGIDVGKNASSLCCAFRV